MLCYAYRIVSLDIRDFVFLDFYFSFTASHRKSVLASRSFEIKNSPLSHQTSWKALGAHVVVITTSPSKVEDAKRLGADEIILSTDN